MNASEATEKIRKLLKRNGRTEAEADTASILAAAIAEKHGIDIAGLDQAEEDRRSEITHKVVIEWVTTPPEADYASLICKRYFEVSPITRVNFTQQQVFVGTERHIQIAEYIFRFLLTEFRWQWNRKRGRCKNRKQFIFGCFIALDAKLRERFARPAGAALELEISWKAKRAAYIAKEFGELTTSDIAPKKRQSAAAQRGFTAGGDIDIRDGLAGGNQRQPDRIGTGQLQLTNGGI